MQYTNSKLYPVPHPFSSGNWGATTAIGNKVIFALCKSKINENVRLCTFNTDAGTITELTQLQEILDQDSNSVAHGKIHTPFLENNGFAYFATHLGEDHKCLNDYAPYPGGRLIAINLETFELVDKGILFKGEGIVSLAIDNKRNHLYGFTWPSANLIKYDINTEQITHLGRYRLGKSGDTTCRTPVIVDDYLLFCTGDGVIHRYDLVTKEMDCFDQTLIEVALEQAVQQNWERPESVRTTTDIKAFVDNYTPEFNGMWHPAIVDPKFPAALVLCNTSSSLLRLYPKDKRIEFIDQFCIEKSLGKYDIKANTSLTLCHANNKRPQ